MTEIQLLELALHKMLANKEYRADIREVLLDLTEMLSALTAPQGVARLDCCDLTASVPCSDCPRPALSRPRPALVRS
jgi:hypothetical protein